MFSPEEVRALVRAAADEQDAAIYLTAVFTGLRRGQLCELPDQPGVPRSSALELAIGAVVVFVWGGALLGGLLPQQGISWQGHFLGAVGGLVAAWVLARPRESAPAIL